ncbi:MAG: hypothetical protein AB7I42_26840 [Bradyrhizobium sp.]|uniref:hypothetical protein n=1 Tax=Bradyrhizobium sp. TaxID=376 RepID=UPI003D0CD81D
MTKPRTVTLAAVAALLMAAAPSWAQEMLNDAEAQDMLFIEQCLQRAATERIPEDRIDDFIDRCLDELYAQKERDAAADDAGADDVRTREEDGAAAPDDAE